GRMAPMVSALQLRPSGAYSRKAPNSEHFVVKSFLSLTQHHHPAQALLAGAGTNRNATSSEKQQPARQRSDISLLEASKTPPNSLWVFDTQLPRSRCKCRRRSAYAFSMLQLPHSVQRHFAGDRLAALRPRRPLVMELDYRMDARIACATMQGAPLGSSA